ncbi:hypothetical protein FACS1894130_00880 [Spirochaetia bacterium]|nr:hypothetical protein FACS1894130_00880 [Spirochaetia bacterium]
MIALLQHIRKVPIRFFNQVRSTVRYLRLTLIVFLCVIALVEYLHAGQVRRTFVFYSLDNGIEALEERMLPRSLSHEAGIRLYVEELLLGPATPNSAPLFPPETGVRSLLYRDGVVYLDLSESAALPGVLPMPHPAVFVSVLPSTPLSVAPKILLDGEGGECFRNLYILNAGIRRNFPFVKDVRLFIAGNEAYPEKFQEIFRKNDKIV